VESPSCDFSPEIIKREINKSRGRTLKKFISYTGGKGEEKKEGAGTLSSHPLIRILWKEGVYCVRFRSSPLSLQPTKWGAFFHGRREKKGGVRKKKQKKNRFHLAATKKGKKSGELTSRLREKGGGTQYAFAQGGLLTQRSDARVTRKRSKSVRQPTGHEHEKFMAALRES